MTDQHTARYPYKHSRDQDTNPPARHPVVVIGAGPVGLCAAIDLAQNGVPVLVLDDNDTVSHGSRAICFSKRTLEIADRLGCGDAMAATGVVWNHGKVFFGTRQTYQFDLLAETGHKHPAFINLQQYHLETYLLDRLGELQDVGHPIQLRGGNKVSAIADHDTFVRLEIDTPEGPYNLEADWLIAADGAASASRRMLGLDFSGRVFDDNFLIADIVMQADFPTERWFWFDPPFNPGQSALLHKQPDDVWRIDLQIGSDIDREAELKPENVTARLRAMLGEKVEFSLKWVSIYTFQCRRMDNFRRGRVLFAGDAAHQVSPFGARGANSGVQDADNLAWKLKLVIDGTAPEALLDSYNDERAPAADHNILASTRSTEFITPKSDTSRLFRDAVLALAGAHEFARPLVNSGRLSLPHSYDNSTLNGPEAPGLPDISRPGAPAPDAPLGDGWLLGRLGDGFVLLCLGHDKIVIKKPPVALDCLQINPAKHSELAARYLGALPAAIYLIRPDQHIAARWLAPDAKSITAALRTASGQDLQRMEK
ncbi:MAG: FAD-dependent oxidoreductase [Paracoccaceae bacterium]